MNLASHLAPIVAAGAVVAAAMLVVLGIDDSVDPVAPGQALAGVQVAAFGSVRHGAARMADSARVLP